MDGLRGKNPLRASKRLQDVKGFSVFWIGGLLPYPLEPPYVLTVLPTILPVDYARPGYSGNPSKTFCVVGFGASVQAGVRLHASNKVKHFYINMMARKA